MKKSTMILTAIALGAILFTSCASNPPPAAATEEVKPVGNTRIVTPRNELTKLANRDYAGHFFGVASAVSNSEDMASREATLMARGELANQIQVLITDAAKRDAMNTHENNAVGGMVETVTAYAKEFVANTTVKEAITELTPEGKYMVYVLVTVSKDDIVKKIEEKMTAEGKIQEAAETRLIMNIIEDATKDIPTE